MFFFFCFFILVCLPCFCLFVCLSICLFYRSSSFFLFCSFSYIPVFLLIFLCLVLFRFLPYLYYPSDFFSCIVLHFFSFLRHPFSFFTLLPCSIYVCLHSVFLFPSVFYLLPHTSLLIPPSLLLLLLLPTFLHSQSPSPSSFLWVNAMEMSTEATRSNSVWP